MTLSKQNFVRCALVLAAIAGLCGAPFMGGCEDLPGSRTEQSTVIGGAAGAGIGAILAKENRLLGALIGGLLGAGGGYLIGAKTDWFEDDDEEVRQEAQQAVNQAQTNPATPEEARSARTADINNDGFVTLDEVVAMKQAGLNDHQMINRLEATGQIFDLNAEQRQYLLDHGVSQNVINRMLAINRQARERYLGSANNNDVISQPSNRD